MKINYINQPCTRDNGLELADQVVVEQELLILPENLEFIPPFATCGVRIAQSLVFSAVYCRSNYEIETMCEFTKGIAQERQKMNMQVFDVNEVIILDIE